MLSFIRGVVHGFLPQSVIILAHDIGYRVFVSDALSHVLSQGTTVSLFLHHLVREDTSDLYGFLLEEELFFFEQLLSVSGVGPKTALAVVGLGPLEKVKGAIAKGDSALLKTVSGIGLRLAERITLELKEKCRQWSVGGDTAQHAQSADGDLIDALVGLGYKEVSAREAVLSLPSDNEDEQQRLKAALRFLGRRY